jgi:hypothetical protein
MMLGDFGVLALTVFCILLLAAFCVLAIHQVQSDRACLRAGYPDCEWVGLKAFCVRVYQGTTEIVPLETVQGQ